MPPVATTRQPTEEEWALLKQAPVKLFGWWTGIVSAACVFVLVFLAAALFAVRFPFDLVVRGAVATAIVASVAWYVWIQGKARRDLGDRAAVLAREAAVGHVRSTIYKVTDAVAVEEREDEGLSYYLLLDDGRTLFLSGQYLYEPADNGFPWESFELVHASSGSWVLRVVALGPRLNPSVTRGPFVDHERSSGSIAADGTIEQRDFNALKASAV